MKIIEYEDKYLEDVKDLLVELEEYILTIDKGGLMNTIYLVRHGQTDWNKYGYAQGTIDIPLNENGIRQAMQLKQQINLDQIDICYVSPMDRAKTTASILLDGTDIKVVYDDRLKERGFGAFEGKRMSKEDVDKLWNYIDIYDKENVETLKECLERAKDFLEYLKEHNDGKNILIVSHGCLIKCLYYNLIGYDKNTNFMEFFPENAKVYKYELK